MADSTELSYDILPKKYKYELQADYELKISIRQKADIVTSPNPFISLKTDGTLLLKSGYAWDGPSGPTIDTPQFMRGSLVHDAVYQLIRDRYLSRGQQKKADKLLRKICIEDGMDSKVAAIVYRAVRLFGFAGLNDKVVTINSPVPLI